MLKRLMILGLIGIAFVLGADYLLVSALNRQVKRERDRQDLPYWNAYTAIVRFGQHPDSASEQKAKGALDDASRKGLSGTRAKILQNYLDDLERCYQNQRDSCNRATGDMNEAMRAPAGQQ